jgi:peptidoglycan-associated lipoprotein
MTRLTLSVVALAAVTAVAGCANKTAVKPPSSATGEQSQTTGPNTKGNPNGVNPNGVTVSDEIQRACKIDFGSVDRAPKFDFDQANLEPTDRDVLRQVAQCLTTGPLKGQAIHLVGRADPRGEEEYNMVLGSSRAASVKTYLSQLGVDQGKISTTSRGKLDANGYDDASWRLDRRVDILLSSSTASGIRARNGG